MHPRIFAERTANAQQRQQAAAIAIAEKLGITPPAEVKEKDAAVRRLKESEALAEWLEGVAAAQVAKPASRKAKE